MTPLGVKVAPLKLGSLVEEVVGVVTPAREGEILGEVEKEGEKVVDRDTLDDFEAEGEMEGEGDTEGLPSPKLELHVGEKLCEVVMVTVVQVEGEGRRGVMEEEGELSLGGEGVVEGEGVVGGERLVERVRDTLAVKDGEGVGLREALEDLEEEGVALPPPSPLPPPTPLLTEGAGEGEG